MIRRRFVELAAAYAALPFVGDEQSQQLLTRAIPSSGELLPLIGMGTWITFDAGRSATARDRLRPVLQTFFDRGGRLVDSSPMYGTSETVVGGLLPKMTGRPRLFAASKVWIPGRRFGGRQYRTAPGRAHASANGGTFRQPLINPGSTERTVAGTVRTFRAD